LTCKLIWQPFILQLHNPFRLSCGVSETRRAFWLRFQTAEVCRDFDSLPNEGWGEAAIPPYYGISDEAMTAFWEQVAADLAGGRDLSDNPAEIETWIGADGPAPARAGLDLALHDRIGRQRNLPLYRLLGLPPPRSLPTSFTIAIAEPEEMARLATEAARYPILKIKLGTADDEARLAAVRAARPDARLRVDVNAGWSAEEAVKRVAALARYDLELIEQPVAKNDIAGMGYVQAHTDLPVVADESVQTLADVEALAAAGVTGINLKLMKVGGLAPGLRMLRRAQELSLKVMLGCMIETSLGVTAMAHLSGLADWLDLDAPLLIANDPFEGVWYDEAARVHAPERPGIGVMEKVTW
jgi:L-alanine-DL-glutamate epimerase-like enolase superfamily enzyme